MNTRGAPPLHLLLDPHDARKAWCSGDGTRDHTGRAGEATCARCLDVALEHYGALHAESSKRVQNLMDRQAEVWCLRGPVASR